MKRKAFTSDDETFRHMIIKADSQQLQKRHSETTSTDRQKSDKAFSYIDTKEENIVRQITARQETPIDTYQRFFQASGSFSYSPIRTSKNRLIF